MNEELQAIKKLLDFIEVSPTAYQTAETLRSEFEYSGFTRLNESESWELEKGHDPDFMPQLNKGPVLKMNADYSYATDAKSALVFDDICNRAGVSYQKYIGRSDMSSGGTIGAVSSAELGIQTVDVGNPMLAMHSIRETAGVSDHLSMIRILKEFYRNGAV